MQSVEAVENPGPQVQGTIGAHPGDHAVAVLPALVLGLVDVELLLKSPVAEGAATLLAAEFQRPHGFRIRAGGGFPPCLAVGRCAGSVLARAFIQRLNLILRIVSPVFPGFGLPFGVVVKMVGSRPCEQAAGWKARQNQIEAHGRDNQQKADADPGGRLPPRWLTVQAPRCMGISQADAGA
jgi:hypothetical protein